MENNLIQLKIEVNDKQEQTISGRALHEFLEVKTAYKDWIKRMLIYGFTKCAVKPRALALGI